MNKTYNQKTAMRLRRRADVELLETRHMFACSDFIAAETEPWHSNPAADHQIYLDFDGHFQSEWATYKNIETPEFSRSWEFPLFFETTSIFEQVADDFAPFNIDVTTESPGQLTDNVLHVVVGGDGIWFEEGSSGASVLNSFSNTELSNVVFVFGDRSPTHAIANAVSYHAGRAFGLLPQASPTTEEIFHPGETDWTPIMGRLTDSGRTTWHDGPVRSPDGARIAYASQDDMKIIASGKNGFGFRSDDHANTPECATPIHIPVFDQFTDALKLADGILTSHSDVDWFSFVWNGGEFRVETFETDNLVPILSLFSGTGDLLAMEVGKNGLKMLNLSPGNYSLSISSDTYGSAGRYSIFDKDDSDVGIGFSCSSTPLVCDEVPQQPRAHIGDFDYDFDSDADDIDLLFEEFRKDEEQRDPEKDIDRDGAVTAPADLNFLLDIIFGTRSGDSNLDGAIDFTDFLRLSSNFGMNDASWAQGDFDGNGVVEFADFLILSRNFGQLPHMS